MPQQNANYEIDDTHSFDENVAAFADALAAIDPVLGPILAANATARLAGKITRAELWDLLAKALEPDAAQ